MRSKFKVTYSRNSEVYTLEFDDVDEAMEFYENLIEEGVRSANLELVISTLLKSFF